MEITRNPNKDIGGPLALLGDEAELQEAFESGEPVEITASPVVRDGRNVYVGDKVHVGCAEQTYMDDAVRLVWHGRIGVHDDGRACYHIDFGKLSHAMAPDLHAAHQRQLAANAEREARVQADEDRLSHEAH